MGLNTDIQIQISGFSDERLRVYVNEMRAWTRELHSTLTKKEVQIATANGATDENLVPIGRDLIDDIEAGNKPLFHGYPIASGDPTHELYKAGLFERIPNIE